MDRDSYLHVDLDLLSSNMEILRKEWGGRKILAVLKANAYGHGAEPLARALEKEGIEYFAVAYLNEALKLRRSISSDILVLTPSPQRLYGKLLEAGLISSLGSYEAGRALLEEAGRLDLKARVEIKVDTGFHRFGFPDTRKSVEEILDLHSRGLEIRGIYSHLALVSDEENRRQYERFLGFIEELKKEGLELKAHIADSIASINHPDYQLDRVRPGAALFGLRSFRRDIGILPIASLYSSVCHLVQVRKGQGLGYDYSWIADRDSLIAQLPLGYADGLPRALGNLGYVIIRGRRAPIVGKICMDVVAVDVTGIEGLILGDEALIFGPGTRGEMTLEEIAGILKTNKNDVISHLAARLPRVYSRKGKKLIVDEMLGESFGEIF